MRPLLLLSLLVTLQAAQTRDRFAWEAEGQKLYNEKQYAQSVEAYRNAIKGGDRTANTQYNLACSLAMAGKTEEAFAALDAAVKAGFDNASHIEQDSDLESLRGDKRWPDIIAAAKKNADEKAARMADPSQSRINIGHLQRFWKAYEAAQKVDPSDRPKIYSDLYFREADGPLTYMLKRGAMTPEKMAQMVEKYGEYFAFLDKHQGDFAIQANALRTAFGKFEKMYPGAKFPDTYVMIGGFNSGGTTSADGLLIGAELFGRYSDTPMQELGDWQKRVLMSPSEFVPLAVHECAHYQQKSLLNRTLLAQTLQEGAADFASYIVTGQMLERTRNLHIWGNSREREIWLEFQKEMNGTTTTGWLYGNPKPGWPDDVSYWLGFKICESYYGRAEDKTQALKDILTSTNPKKFLEESKYAEKFGG